MSAKKKGGKDEGVVTSASSVGSLLTDLLSEAKKDVAAERKELDQQLKARADAEKAAAVREEDKKRQAMQEKVIAETRLRNQALSQRDRNKSARVAASTAPQLASTAPKKVAEVPRPATKTNMAAAPQRSLVMMAAVVVIGVGIGLVGTLLFSAEAKATWPDVGLAAKSVLAQASTAGAIEAKADKALATASGEIAQLRKDIEAVRKAQADMAAQLTTTKEQLATAEQALSELKSAKRPGKRRTRRRAGTGGGANTLPKIDTTVF